MYSSFLLSKEAMYLIRKIKLKHKHKRRHTRVRDNLSSDVHDAVVLYADYRQQFQVR